MPYTPVPFENWPSTATPLSAEVLNEMQDVIVQAADNAEAAAASAAELAALVEAPADAVVAGLVNNEASATGTALVTKYVKQTALDGQTSALFTGATATRTTTDARYRASPAPGTYAARPAATAVTPGSFYVATNVQEMYVSDGTVWTVTGSGGNELARAQYEAGLTSSTTLAAAPTLVPGMTVTWVAGERPARVDVCADLANSVAGNVTELWVNLDDAAWTACIGTIRQRAGAVDVAERVMASFKIPTLTAGTTHSIKIGMSTPSGAARLVGITTSPSSLSVVSR